MEKAFNIIMIAIMAYLYCQQRLIQWAEFETRVIAQQRINHYLHADINRRWLSVDNQSDDTSQSTQHPNIIQEILDHHFRNIDNDDE